jgi:tetratricopeptide (TPR) repeat protein
MESLRRVRYVSKRVPYHTSWTLRPGREIAEFEDKMAFSKNNEWRYEMEMRQKFDLKSLIKRPLSDGTLGYFLSIPADAILTVSLGMKCRPKIEGRIRTLLKRRQSRHVKLERATLHKSKFELVFNPAGPAPQSRGRLDGEIARQTKAIRVNPHNADAYYNRGIAKQTKGDLDGAIADYSEAIKLAPDNKEAYEQRGITKSAKGDAEGAIADHIKAAKLSPRLFR